MQSPTEMAIAYLNEIRHKQHRIELVQYMIKDLERVYFTNTGAFDEIEREIDKAIEYLENELKEMIDDK